MILLSRNLVLSGAAGDHPNDPVIGWQSVATAAAIAADSEAAAYPASNLATPVTHEEWQSESTADQYLTVTTGTADPLDYVGIAGHNFGTDGIAVSIEGRASILDAWSEIIPEFLPSNDSPIMTIADAAGYAQKRVKLQPGAVAPRAAILYVGKALRVPRRLYVGHTPIVDGLVIDTTDGRSKGGYLGSIINSEHNETSINFNNLDPAWYRTYMRPFVEARVPFFWGWRPSDYPREIGFCWFPSGHNPRPVNQRNNGMMQIALQVEGIV